MARGIPANDAQALREMYRSAAGELFSKARTQQERVSALVFPVLSDLAEGGQGEMGAGDADGSRRLRPWRDIRITD